jgi:hypothetical protein
MRPASCEKGFRRKCNIGNPFADGVDDFDDQLCNIESSTGMRPNGVYAMVTAALKRIGVSANADKETTEKPAS